MLSRLPDSDLSAIRLHNEAYIQPHQLKFRIASMHIEITGISMTSKCVKSIMQMYVVENRRKWLLNKH